MDRAEPTRRQESSRRTPPSAFADREGPAEPPPPPKDPYPAEKARGGEIILRTPARRAIFLAGLIGAVILAILSLVLAR
ncbi:hypothetical protein EAV90_09205 [Bradyrhizobium vignae]|nr:hypothetical protein EAV90_09205 [Bradyrhizobium vignae]